MTKDELKTLQERYNMEFIRDSVTREGSGIFLVSDQLIPELDAIVENEEAPHPGMVAGTRELLVNKYHYKIYCPKTWIDLWGWA